MRSVALAALALVACGKGTSAASHEPAGRDAAVPTAPEVALVTAPGDPIALPPAPPVPTPPPGLPPLPTDHAPAPEEVALGELLFFDARLSADGQASCARCHDPEHGFAGTDVRAPSAAGKPNLRHTPTLYNLAWHPDLGWDGRGTDRAGFIAVHAAGQLGRPLARSVAALAASPTYRAHLARAAKGRDPAATAAGALLAYAITRFSGDAPWDAIERIRAEGGTPDDPAAATAEAGYRLFTGKAQCATCHPPPLYTDLGYHRLGLVASPDEGRGTVDPAATGAFKVPTLRGARTRAPLFHDGSAATLEAAIDWHLAGGRGQGADPRLIDPALIALTLTGEEREQLLAFVRALTPAGAPVVRPPLPDDLPRGTR